MASEIRFGTNLSVSKNGADASSNSSSTQNMAGSNMVKKTLTVLSAGWNAIDLGPVTGVPAKIKIKNLDAANYLEMATDNAGANKFIKLIAGDENLISPASATIYVKANTANVLVQVVACEA